MYGAAVSCKDIALAPVTNWEPHCVTLAGYCYAVRHGMKVRLVPPYRASHNVTVRGNVTSVYPPLRYLSGTAEDSDLGCDDAVWPGVLKELHCLFLQGQAVLEGPVYEDRSFETSGSAVPTAQFHIPEDLNRQGLRILWVGPVSLCFVVNCCDVN
jgi:hypothetical protein